MKRAMFVATALALVAGCSKREMAKEATLAKPEAPAASTQAVAAPPAEVAAAADAAPAPPPATPSVPVPAGAPMLAYSYRYGVEVPANRLRGLIKAHEQACAAAGGAVCQVIGQSVESTGRDEMQGELELRATPAWLTRFRDGLDGQARQAGGRVTSANTQSEDLSRSIVDTEAALRAKTTLRDRLQGLLASHPGKLSDLLEVEQALAQVQGEIDATQSELAVMRTRVATSALTISYRSEGVLAPQGVMSPLKRAVDDFLGIMVAMVAGIIRFIAVILPIGLIVAFVGWLFRKPLSRVRRPKPKPTPPPSAP